MKPYNPLEKNHLGKSVVLSLIKRQAIPFADLNRFSGAGVYAIYYTGDFDAYMPMKIWNQDRSNPTLPIYVGKAIPTGGRKGNVDAESATKSCALFNRLDEHRKSIESVKNLKHPDFLCRFLVVDDIWIPLGESLLIQYYRPIWNAIVDGFGNHDPGSGRHNGARPSWDTLHPGRKWAERCAASRQSEASIRSEISRFWESYPGPRIED